MDKYIGKRLDGKYEIHELIGVGGMAYVYKAYDRVGDRWVAIKILKEEFSNNSDFLRRFRNEAKAITLLSHPNIVGVYDVSFGDQIQYIVMEYIDGITLKQYIEQEGTIRWQEAPALHHPDPAGPGARPREGHHPPGHQAPEHHAAAGRDHQGGRFRHRPVPAERDPDHDRQGHRLCALHRPGTGQGRTTSPTRRTSTPWASCSTRCSPGSCPSPRTTPCPWP